MRRFIVNLIVEQLAAGHSVTYMTPSQGVQSRAFTEVARALLDLDVRIKANRSEQRYIELANGAWFQSLRLARTGASGIHSPVLVLHNVAGEDPELLQEARAIACPFPGGRPPIIVEC